MIRLAFALLLPAATFAYLARAADEFVPFEAPELTQVDVWVNSKGVKLADQKGKVVVVHFFTTGCINCIRNYPSYNAWRKAFDEKDVAIIGVHTPEFDSEKQIDTIKRKADDAKLAFPIAVDNEHANWKAWGVRYWPTVFLVDKQGKVRDRWEGELKWNGNDGEKKFKERIEELLKEKG